MKHVIAATSTTGRKIHMGWDSGQIFCQLTPGGARVKDTIANLGDEGAETTIAALAAANVAPSKLCGHCYSPKLRKTYAKHVTTKEAHVDLNRTHIERVTDYVCTLPDDSGKPWYNSNSDSSRLVEALGLAANLHNPALIVALTKTRTVADSADDLERIADTADVDEATRRSMRHVARMLRDYTREGVR